MLSLQNLLEDVAALRGSGCDDIFSKVEIVLLAGEEVKLHHRLKDRRRFDLCGTPAKLGDAFLRSQTDLVDHAPGFLLQSCENPRILFHISVVLKQTEHHVLPLPDVTVTVARLVIHSGAANAAIALLGGHELVDETLRQFLEFRVAVVAVKQGVRADALSRHLAEGELRTSLDKVVDDLVVRHHSVDPVVDGVLDVIGEVAVECHTSGRERLDHISHLLQVVLCESSDREQHSCCCENDCIFHCLNH